MVVRMDVINSFRIFLILESVRYQEFRYVKIDLVLVLKQCVDLCNLFKKLIKMMITALAESVLDNYEYFWKI